MEFACPNCGNILLSSPELLGTRGQCRKCQHIFTITTDQQALRASTVAKTLVFHCPDCDQLFEGKPEMEGRSGKCHQCQAVFTIHLQPAAAPQSSSPTVERSPVSSGGAPTAAPRSSPKVSSTDDMAHNASASKKPQLKRLGSVSEAPPIQFHCAKCRGLMEVPASTVGLETACPYCSEVQTIPSPTHVEPPRSKAKNHLPANRSHPSQSRAPNALWSDAGFGPSSATAQTDETNTRAAWSSDLAQHGQLSASDFPPAQFNPLATVNPYASSSMGSYPLRTARSSGSSHALTFANVFRVAFAGLFPTVLVIVLHVLITIGAVMGGGMLMFGMSLLVATLGLPPYAALACILGFYALLLPLAIALMAWFSASVRSMALNAVRGQTFDFTKSFSAGSGFSTACVIIVFQILLQLLQILPQFLVAQYAALAIAAAVIVVALTIFMLLTFSLATFAAIDGEHTGEALATSSRLVFSNLPVMLAVKTVVWLMTIVLYIPTLGLALALPVYFNATLYSLAKRSA